MFRPGADVSVYRTCPRNNEMKYESVINKIRTYLRETGQNGDLLKATIEVRARPLSTEEVIGDPEHEDYPLVDGREKMMEARVRGARGHAFTDMYGHWQGKLEEVCDIESANNYRRAILVATLNAVMRYRGEVAHTVHCKDEGPVQCAEKLPSFVDSEGLKPPFALVGYQPRLAECLATLGPLTIVDMDPQNVGQDRAGTTVMPPEEADEVLDEAACAFVTGSTIVNGTFHQFTELNIPTIFFGVTIAGAAELLGLKRYCPLCT